MNMPTIAEQTARLNQLLAAWRTYRAPLTDPQLSCQLKTDLYQVRNAGWNGNPPLSTWPAHLIDSDDAMMAAVEHYFLCRCWVGTGQQPAWQMRLMNNIYDLGKMFGVTPQHNPNRPVSRVTAIQMAAKEAGVRDGEADLERTGGSAPLVAMPPTY
jgi:hypothetical protein